MLPAQGSSMGFSRLPCSSSRCLSRLSSVRRERMILCVLLLRFSHADVDLLAPRHSIFLSACVLSRGFSAGRKRSTWQKGKKKEKNCKLRASACEIFNEDPVGVHGECPGNLAEARDCCRIVSERRTRSETLCAVERHGREFFLLPFPPATLRNSLFPICYLSPFTTRTYETKLPLTKPNDPHCFQRSTRSAPLLPPGNSCFPSETI